MATSLWRSINYKTPAKYFINTYIREYDLSKANINSLLYTGRITQEKHNEYLQMPKQKREVEIGLWIKKDRTVYKDIQKGIIEAKRLLVMSNSLEDYDIVSVKNDAMFIVGKDLQFTEFPPFKFNVKNIYTVYLQLQELEVYYGDFVDPETNLIHTNLDVKGIDDDKVMLHQGGMLDLICDLCYKLQRENIEETMRWLSEMYQLYITRSLPKEYYRDFDTFSGFRFKTFMNYLTASEIDESMKQYIDINRNLLIFRDLMFIVSDVYRSKMMRR